MLESLSGIKQGDQQPLETLKNAEKPLKKIYLRKNSWNLLGIPWKLQRFPVRKKSKLEPTLPINFSTQWGFIPEFLELPELHLIFLCTWNIPEKQCFKLNVLEFFLDFQLLPKKHYLFSFIVSNIILSCYIGGVK